MKPIFIDLLKCYLNKNIKNTSNCYLQYKMYSKLYNTIHQNRLTEEVIIETKHI